MDDKANGATPPQSPARALRIDELIVPGTKGRIGMTGCPGRIVPPSPQRLCESEPENKLENSAADTFMRQSVPALPLDAAAHDVAQNKAQDTTHAAAQDAAVRLASDLEAIKSWGAEILISLIEEDEYAMAAVEALPRLIPEGILHLRLPIEDASIPDAAWEDAWAREGPGVRAALARGGRVCIHCMGGYGRTGLLAARLLVEFGLPPAEAIARVRRARPGAIETAGQEDYIASLF